MSSIADLRYGIAVGQRAMGCLRRLQAASDMLMASYEQVKAALDGSGDLETARKDFEERCEQVERLRD